MLKFSERPLTSRENWSFYKVWVYGSAAVLSTFLRNSLKRPEKSLYRTIHCIQLDCGFFM